MISSQVIKKSLEQLTALTRVEFYVFDTEGVEVSSTGDCEENFTEAIKIFAISQADSQEVKGYHFFRVQDEGTTEFVLVAKGAGEDVHTMGKIAVCQLQDLMSAYRERYDRGSFIQNLLLDNLLLLDVFNRAKKLHIDAEARRLVYVIETKSEKDNTAMEILKGLFSGNPKDFLTAVDEKNIIYVKEFEDGEDEEQADSTAQMILDMLNSEAMSSVRVAYGTIVSDIQQVSRSYKEARMALDVGRIFYPQQFIHSYSKLGIGRLIFQLPRGLCEMFIEESFRGQKPDELDKETLDTINKFFDNSLNVSETARQLFVHRNTLVYRLEKLQKSTGLDIRLFDDALTFKIAMMVTNYMKFMDSNELN